MPRPKRERLPASAAEALAQGYYVDFSNTIPSQDETTWTGYGIFVNDRNPEELTLVLPFEAKVTWGRPRWKKPGEQL